MLRPPLLVCIVLGPCCSSCRDEDDMQDEDGSFWGGSDEELDKASDLDREWRRRRDQFSTIGYRDGLIAGKEAIAQEGFNIGFKQSAVVGYQWGVGRGITSFCGSLNQRHRSEMRWGC